MTVSLGSQAQEEVSLRDLLAGYDRRVDACLRDALESKTGTDRTNALHVLRRSIAVHDSVLESVLCPLLDGLPSGTELARRLRRGCAERARLLDRFQTLADGTTARNLYPVSGPDLEDLLVDVAASFRQHADDETVRVTEVLAASAGSVHPDVVAARMAIESSQAPTRIHSAAVRHPGSAVSGFYHYVDRIHDWNDSHHGWPPATPPLGLPVRPGRPPVSPPPSIPDLLAGYDRAARAIIDELDDPDLSPSERAADAYRLNAAVAIHDSVLEGTLCPLMESMPEGRELAGRLRRGCEDRARHLAAWDALTRRVAAEDMFATHAAEANATIGPLVESFRWHADHETAEVAALVESLRGRSWPWKGAAGGETLWVGPNPEPAVLAANMALWAGAAPTHAHPLAARHPDNRLVRTVFRQLDRFRDWRATRRGWPSVK